MINAINSVIRIVRQLNTILSKTQKMQSIIVFLSMLVLSLLDLLSISSVYPLLALINGSESMGDAWYVRAAFQLFGDMDYNSLLILFCIVIIVVFLSKNAFAIFLTYIQQRFGTRFLKEESSYILDIYMRQPYEYFLNTNSSEIQRGVNGDVSSAYQILISLFQIVGEILTIICITIFLFITDWIVTIGALGIGFFTFIVIVFGLKQIIKEVGRLRREAELEQVMTSYQAINAIKEISVLNRRDFFVNKYKHAAEKSEKATLVYSVINACPDRILEGVCLSGFVLVVLFRIMLSGDASSLVPVLGTFAMATFKILPSISKVSTRINSLVYYQFGLQNCYNVIGGIGLHKSVGLSKTNTAARRKHVNSNEEGVVIKGVSFRYWNTQDDVISDLSLSVKKGESVALIGSSGAGKTTLADIIMGLLIPQKGIVEIYDEDNFSSAQQRYENIGYVPQSVFLIDDTVRANVAFGISVDSISDEKIWAALEQAQLKSFVERLPDGLDTIVGERGVKFSGGQRQRIAIARALYEDPDILVLDEATSALDAETENAVMESIEALQGRKTLIIVAHRLSTIRNCDVIYEIVEGKAVERSKEEVFGDEIET